MLKILSMDGGGTRGILPASLLALLEEEMQITDKDYRLRDSFDIVAGTSTGGMLALGVASGIPMRTLSEVYLHESKTIFTDSVWDNIKDLGSTLGAQYDQKHLRKILEREEIFGSKTIANIPNNKINVLVPTFDLSPEVKGANRNFRPRVFNSFYERDANETLVDIALRTSAAPTVFPIYQQKYIDGGVAMNNPSMAAIAFAMNQANADHSIYGGAANKKKGLARSADEICLVSLGTGTSGRERIEEKDIGDGDWGASKWISHLSSLLTTSNMRASEYYAASVLSPQNYFRHQFDLNKIEENGDVPLDCTDEEQLQAMLDLAKHDFEIQKSKIIALISR